MKDVRREHEIDRYCSHDTISTNASEHCLSGNKVYVEGNNGFSFKESNLKDIAESKCGDSGCIHPTCMSNDKTKQRNEDCNRLKNLVCNRKGQINDQCSTFCGLHDKPQANRYRSDQFSPKHEPLSEKDSISNIDNVSSVSEATSSYKISISRSQSYPKCDSLETSFKETAHGCRPDESSVAKKEYDDFSDEIKLVKEYDELKIIYHKVKKTFLILAITDIILIILVVAMVPPVAIRSVSGPVMSGAITSAARFSKLSSVEDNVCFDCADLEIDPNFTLQTLIGIKRQGNSCCFNSITSIYLSLKQLFQKQAEEKLNELNHTLNLIQRNSIISENGKNQNNGTENIIRQIFLLDAPKEKTAIHLTSARGSPVEDKTLSGIFHKVKWNPNGEAAVLTGKATVHSNGLGVQVQSEGYYFLYIRLHFLSKMSYRDLKVSYNINRQRGSTSTHIHETRESCVSRGSSMEHNGATEMITHLLRYDIIFISVPKSDIKYLSAESGAHIFGLFAL